MMPIGRRGPGKEGKVQDKTANQKMTGLMSFLVSQVYTLAGRSVVDVVYEDKDAGKRINQEVNMCLLKVLRQYPAAIDSPSLAFSVMANDLDRIAETIRRNQ